MKKSVVTERKRDRDRERGRERERELNRDFVSESGVEEVCREMGHSEGKTGGGEAPPTTTRSRGGNDDLEAHMLEEDADEQRRLDGVPAALLENRLPTPQTDSLLYVCAVLSIVSALGSVLCMVVNLISLLRSFDYRGFDYRVSVRTLSLCLSLCLHQFAGLFSLWHGITLTCDWVLQCSLYKASVDRQQKEFCKKHMREHILRCNDCLFVRV